MSQYWRGIGLPWGTTIPSVFDPKDDFDIIKSSILWIVLTGLGERCFAGDTKVSLAEGTEICIKDLAERDYFWVYSYDSVLEQIVPGKAIAFKTHDAALLVEVTLDNGKKVKCTPDHGWMLRDGTYREAKDLKPGDSLMPLYRKYNEDIGLPGYELHYVPYLPERKDKKVVCAECGKLFDRITVSHLRCTHKFIGSTPVADYKKKHPGAKIAARKNVDGKWSFTHRRFVLSEKKSHQSMVHHKDQNALNNSPDNLVWMSNDEHHQIHVEIAQKMSKAFLEKFAKDPEFVEYFKRQVSLGQQEKWNRWRGDELKEGRTVLLWDTLQRRLSESIKIPAGEAVNHKVVQVQKLEAAEPVYDLHVEKYHNFALAAGVFVHNCMNPEFGSRLPYMVFEPNDLESVNQVKESVREAITRWDDRVEFVDFSVKPYENEMRCTILYKIATDPIHDDVQRLDFALTEDMMVS